MKSIFTYQECLENISRIENNLKLYAQVKDNSPYYYNLYNEELKRLKSWKKELKKF